MRRIGRLSLAGSLACVLGLGCGEGWQAETYPASGRVTINGKPPAGALVQLHPTGGEKADVRNSRPWGLVQEDGRYSLSTYGHGDGAPVGEYAFTITWPVDPSVPSLTDRLGYRYSRPERSKWRLTIEPIENELPPIEMTNVAVAMDPRPPATGSTGAPPMPGMIPRGGTGGR